MMNCRSGRLKKFFKKFAKPVALSSALTIHTFKKKFEYKTSLNSRSLEIR